MVDKHNRGYVPNVGTICGLEIMCYTRVVWLRCLVGQQYLYGEAKRHDPTLKPNPSPKKTEMQRKKDAD